MEFEKICDIIAVILDVSREEIKPESRFVEDLSCDSLDVAQIVVEVEDAFKIKIPDEMLEGVTKVGDIEELLKNRK